MPMYANIPRRLDQSTRFDVCTYIACRYSLNFCHDFKDLTKCYRLLSKKVLQILRLQYNFRYTDARYYHCVIHLKRYLSKLYPYLAGLLPRHSVLVLYQNKLKRQKRARHFTDGYTVRVYSNSFIEALHVLHEMLATNNCFSAKACWYFLISKTYRPVEMASATHMFRNALCDNERTEREWLWQSKDCAGGSTVTAVH